MTKLLSKKSFIAFLIVCAVIVLAGIVAVSVAGFNADATVGGGQQLIYEKVFSKDDFQKEAQTIRDYLKNNGARVSSLQPRENISDRDNYDAIVVNFTSDKPIESATINGVQCRSRQREKRQAFEARFDSSCGGSGHNLSVCFVEIS